MNQKNDGQQIVAGRVNVYGDPTESFARVAEVWSGILGVPVHAWQVPLCLAGLKLVRTAYAPDYSDNSNDIDGYVDIFKQIIGEDMIDAKTVAEYLEQKNNPIVNLVIPKDTYTHINQSGRACTWDTGIEDWVYWTDTGYQPCNMEHP